jgi:hypothetical protein
MKTVVHIPTSTSSAQASGGQTPGGENAPSPGTESPSMPEYGYGYGNDSRIRTRPRPGQEAAFRAKRSSSESKSYSPFWPLLLGTLAMLGWLGFQTQQLFNERQALQLGYASQQQTVDNAGKLRASLDALAADTQRMADGGNPNAKLLVDELRKRGITINAAAPAVTRPDAAK